MPQSIDRIMEDMSRANEAKFNYLKLSGKLDKSDSYLVPDNPEPADPVHWLNAYCDAYASVIGQGMRLAMPDGDAERCMAVADYMASALAAIQELSLDELKTLSADIDDLLPD